MNKLAHWLFRSDVVIKKVDVYLFDDGQIFSGKLELASGDALHFKDGILSGAIVSSQILSADELRVRQRRAVADADRYQTLARLLDEPT